MGFGNYNISKMSAKVSINHDLIEVDINSEMPGKLLHFWFWLTRPEGYARRRARILAKRRHRKRFNSLCNKLPLDLMIKTLRQEILVTSEILKNRPSAKTVKTKKD